MTTRLTALDLVSQDQKKTFNHSVSNQCLEIISSIYRGSQHLPRLVVKSNGLFLQPLSLGCIVLCLPLTIIAM